jgi:hypothetical protein
MGNQYQHFDGKEYKNGSKRIIKRKEPTIRNVALKNTSQPKVDVDKVYLTDNQILMEHIIKLNKKVEKLKSKHMEYDDLIYGNVSYNASTTPQRNEIAEDLPKPDIVIEDQTNIPETKQTSPKKVIKRSCRDNIKYLP